GTAMALNVAKSFKGTQNENFQNQVAEESCQQYLHWDLSSFGLEKLLIRPNDVLGQILSNKGVEYFKIDKLVEAAKSIFPFRSIRAGKELTFVKDLADSSIQCVIYEPDPYRQILYHLGDSVRVEVIQRETETKIETASGTIDGTLWASMESQNLPTDLISTMEDALGWSVDFFHMQKGDAYKLLYERKYVEGQPVGIGKLLGAVYTSGDDQYYSIRFNSGTYDGYYDLEGRPMKKAFLKSPVEYARISSHYSLNRFHPILKINRGHFGTDYAAPCGTPIRAVADGTIEKATYAGGNGNFVKIRHDKTYETQYLHMSRFGPGIHPGVHVQQGQTIGYVGQTGLATGCHVCFRFWKNGKQVDHLKEKMPPPQAMDPSMLPEYFKIRDDIKAKLDGLLQRPVSQEITS
ncbi:MAG TPA: peptidoglycan DD-metalloendopeptidase family protein, partial [Saprospiraceae bacterium]|nr:peptidoglycan DD-metalloendopeptidase family protein [Saprospiraceae bacterium]